MTVRASVTMTIDDLKGPGTVLTDADRRDASKIIGVTFAKIAAIEAVESRGHGFRPDAVDPTQARPIILFEPHVFHRLTKGKFSEGWPDISYPTWGTKPYPASQSARWAELAKALTLDETAALASTSWGLFQIMGYNFKAAGGAGPDAAGVYASVQAFARAMASTEGEQLRALARFIKVNPAMQKALQLSDWAGYARLYNGPGYAQQGYDQKLKAAYKKALAAAPVAGVAA